MTAFSVSPAQGFTPATDEGFPQFIQFQADGVNLGGPDADTLDFGPGLTATRGTGENENKITVDADGGSGGNPSLAVSLTGAAAHAMDGAVFSNWTGTALNTSTDASWSQPDQAIKFLSTGLFRVQITGYATRHDGGPWPTLETFVGSAVAEDVLIPRTVYARDDNNTGAGETAMAWSDEFVVNVTVLNTLIKPKVYAESYASSATTVDFKARVVVQKL